MSRFFLGVALMSGVTAGAQTPASSSGDTAAIRVVLTAAVAALAGDGLIPVFPQPAQPWRIVAANSASPDWSAALTRLRSVLQARLAVPSDSLAKVLEFSPLRISSDSLFAWFTIRSEWRCGSSC